MIARYGENDYGYSEAGYGYGVSAFTGFDGLAAVPDLLGWWSVSRRVLARYSGPVIRLRRSSDSTEQDFYGIGPQGEVSTAELRAWNGWNRLTQSDKLFGGSWSGTSFGVGSIPTATENAGIGPFGANTATRVQLDCVDDTLLANRSIWRHASYSVTSGVNYTCSFWIKAYDPANVGKTIRFICEGATSAVVVTLTSDWQFISATGITSSTSVNFIIETRGLTTSRTADILVSHAQSERASSFSTYEPRTTTAAGDSFLVTLYDQSGLARNFTQSTTTLQPIVCEQGVPVTENGRLAAKFVAADARRMSIASSTAMFNALHSTGGTVLAVARANDTAAAKTIFTNKNGTTSPGVMLQMPSTEVLQMYCGRLDVAGVATNGTSVAFTPAVGEATTALTVWAATLDPDNATAASRAQQWRNGTASAYVNGDSGTPFVENAQGNMTLGARTDGSLTHDGTISEVAAFSAAISTADRTAYQSRSGTFYGVTIS